MNHLKGKKAFCLITGGSQGIGQCIAIEFAKILAPGSKLCLTARSENGLKDTISKISSEKIGTECVACDLSSDVSPLVKRLESFKDESSYEAYFLVHNAGSEGNGSLAKDMNDSQYWQQYMALNLYSMTTLTSAFLGVFGSSAVPKTIVNITSLAAVVPFKGLGYYCVGKASREMYLKVLAEENPDLRILSYSPGPVKTEMIGRVINSVGDEGTKGTFVSMRDENKLLEPSDTIGKMIQVLDTSAYTNGGRVDYFDL